MRYVRKNLSEQFKAATSLLQVGVIYDQTFGLSVSGSMRLRSFLAMQKLIFLKSMELSFLKRYKISLPQSILLYSFDLQ